MIQNSVKNVVARSAAEVAHATRIVRMFARDPLPAQSQVDKCPSCGEPLRHAESPDVHGAVLRVRSLCTSMAGGARSRQRHYIAWNDWSRSLVVGSPKTEGGNDFTQALDFIRRHGILLESARGSAPSLAEVIAGAPVRGSWYGLM
jgi:hypothetical protein